MLLARGQELDPSDPTRFRYELRPNGDFSVKHGAYVEVAEASAHLGAVGTF